MRHLNDGGNLIGADGASIISDHGGGFSAIVGGHFISSGTGLLRAPPALTLCIQVLGSRR